MNFSSVEDLTCEYSERTLVLPYHQCSVQVYTDMMKIQHSATAKGQSIIIQAHGSNLLL